MTGVCVVCGQRFDIPKNNPRKRYCSRKCHNYEYALRKPSAAEKRVLAAKTAHAAEIRSRLAARDAEYAAVGVAVTVEVRGGLRVETRG